MSQVRFIVDVDVDDELLAEHDGTEKPPPNNIREWYGGDLQRAVDAGLAEFVHAEQLEVVRVTP